MKKRSVAALFLAAVMALSVFFTGCDLEIGTGTGGGSGTGSGGGSGTSVTEVTQIVLNPSELTLTLVDDGAPVTGKITAEVLPANATDKTVAWTCSNGDVAMVTDGTVTAVGVGTATVTATSVNGVTANCTVNVVADSGDSPDDPMVAVTGVSLNTESLSLTEGGTQTLIATVTPANATDKTLTWTSDNTAVATVSGGTVTAVSAGTATVKVSSSNGKSASCTVTVTAKPPVVTTVDVTGVSLNTGTLSLTVGESQTLIATVTPSDATDKTLTWASDNTAIATVSGGTVTAVSAGTATVTASSHNKITAACTVTVSLPVPPVTQYTVSFMSDGALVDTQTVDEGGKVTAPTGVIKDGYYLVGWTTSTTSGALYDFDTAVTTSFELYAKWQAMDATSPVTYAYSGNECVAFEWTDENFAAAKAEYKLSTASTFVQADAELIRSAGTDKARVDIVGLKGGAQYDFRITLSSGEIYLINGMSVSSYDRSGYAHFNYASGVGAYNDDGTLKSGAVVVYVTEATKNTVTAKVNGSTRTGIVSILQNAGTSTPLVVRIIGTVGAATWNPITYTKTSSNVDEGGNLVASAIVDKNGNPLPQQTMTQAALISGGYNTLNTSVYSELNGLSSQIKWSSGEFDSCWNDCSISGVKNVTLEGIGEDARIFQWGLTWKNCNSIEVRNLTFEDYTEDACSFEGSMTSASSISDFTSTNFWIHHNTFEQGINYWDVCPEQDKHEGDGATDFKGVAFVTLSYNEYHENHKTGLIGGSNSQTTASVTFHHNYYNACNSRLPLARQANMHMYNNYYYNSTGTNMSLRAGAYAFIENCYFENANNPIVIESRDDTYGIGAAKLYGNIFVGKQYATTNGYIYEVTDRTQTVTNENKFAPNFDTDSTVFYYDSVNRKSDVTSMLTAEEVKTQVPLLAGVQKRSDSSSGDITDGGSTGGSSESGTTGGDQIASGTVIIFSNGPKTLVDGVLSETVTGVTVTPGASTDVKMYPFAYNGVEYANGYKLNSTGEVTVRFTQDVQVTFCYYDYNSKQNTSLKIGGVVYGGTADTLHQDTYGYYHLVTVSLSANTDYSIVRGVESEVALCYMIIN